MQVHCDLKKILKNAGHTLWKIRAAERGNKPYLVMLFLYGKYSIYSTVLQSTVRVLQWVKLQYHQ